MTFFQWFDRMGRPALRVVGVLLVALIGAALAYAYWRAAITGHNVPDMSGGLAPILAIIVPQVTDLITRHLQRQKEIAFAQYPARGMAQ